MPYPVTIHKVHNPKPIPAQQPVRLTWMGKIVAVVVFAAAAGVAAVASSIYVSSVFVGEALVFSWESLRELFSWKTHKQLESAIHQKGLGNWLNQIKKIDGLNKRLVIKRLSHCPKNSCEMKILKHLETLSLSRIELKEMLQGAHIHIYDNGKAFEEWSKLLSKKNRISSHPSTSQQFSIQGKFLREMLFSAHIDFKGNRYTWFQLEKNPANIGYTLRHLIDFVKYKISSANQGPFGRSFFTHHKPLLLTSQ